MERFPFLFERYFVLDLQDRLLVCRVELKRCINTRRLFVPGQLAKQTLSRLAFLDASLAACLGAFRFLLCFWYLPGTYTIELVRERDVFLT